MKRKRKLDLREFLFKIYNKITRTQKYCIALVLLFFIGNTFLTQNLISKEIKSTGSVLFLVNQFGIWFGIAFLILVLLISQYALKWIFFLKILVSYVDVYKRQSLGSTPASWLICDANYLSDYLYRRPQAMGC